MTSFFYMSEKTGALLLLMRNCLRFIFVFHFSILKSTIHKFPPRGRQADSDGVVPGP